MKRRKSSSLLSFSKLNLAFSPDSRTDSDGVMHKVEGFRIETMTPQPSQAT